MQLEPIQSISTADTGIQFVMPPFASIAGSQCRKVAGTYPPDPGLLPLEAWILTFCPDKKRDEIEPVRYPMSSARYMSTATPAPTNGTGMAFHSYPIARFPKAQHKPNNAHSHLISPINPLTPPPTIPTLVSKPVPARRVPGIAVRSHHAISEPRS